MPANSFITCLICGTSCAATALAAVIIYAIRTRLRASTLRIAFAGSERCLAAVVAAAAAAAAGRLSVSR